MSCNEPKSIKGIPAVRVEASTLSLYDDFLNNHTPKTSAEKDFMREVEAVIKAGVKDFCRFPLAPSLDPKGEICYCPGMEPAVNMSYHEWEEKAANAGLRLGTYPEYIAYLAVFIKKAPSYGKSYEWAWNAVCNNSEELGKYWDYEWCRATGKDEICGEFDMVRSYKVLAMDDSKGCFYLGAGYCRHPSVHLPVARVYPVYDPNAKLLLSTGWLVGDCT